MGRSWFQILGFERLKTALIAGGAGFIGSHLTKRLLENNLRVIVWDNLITGYVRNLEDVKDHRNFYFEEVDICEQNKLFIEENIDYIFHLASPASPPKYFAHPHLTIKVNTTGTDNMLQLAKIKNARIIFASTSEIYGDPLVSPQGESYWGNVNPIGPRSIYDEAKRLGETLCSQYHREGVDVGIVRIFNTYGPLMDPFDGRVVSTFIRQALSGEKYSIQGTGEQTRSFCFVEDLVRGIELFSNLEIMGPINLGNPNEMKVLDLAKFISETLNTKTQYEFLPELEDDPQRRRPDISAAKSLLNWEPIIGLTEGINATARWMSEILNKSNNK
jgi:nucleoside-diphosphate-sugar epimerase